MSTEKNSFFLQFQLLLDAYQQRSHIKTSNIVMQQYRCYYCPNEFPTFLERIDHTCIHHQEQKIKIKIVKTSVCLLVVFVWVGRELYCLNPGVGTARSLLVHTWARLIGLRNLHKKYVNATSAEKRLVRKRNFPIYIPHRRDFKQYSQNACFCMFG